MSNKSLSEKIGIASAFILFLHFINFGRTPARFAAIITVLLMVLITPNIGGDMSQSKITNARIAAIILIPLVALWKQKRDYLPNQSGWIAFWAIVWGLYGFGTINNPMDNGGHSEVTIAIVSFINCIFCLIYSTHIHNKSEV